MGLSTQNIIKMPHDKCGVDYTDYNKDVVSKHYVLQKKISWSTLLYSCTPHYTVHTKQDIFSIQWFH